MHPSYMFMKNYLHCSVLQVINDMNQIWIYFKQHFKLVSNKLTQKTVPWFRSSILECFFLKECASHWSWNPGRADFLFEDAETFTGRKLSNFMAG